MSSMRLAFSSDRPAGSERIRPADVGRNLSDPPVRPLSSLIEGDHAVIVGVIPDSGGRADRLLALGVTAGAAVTMLQTFPGVVFLCDQTELAVERNVAAAVLVRLQEKRT